MAPDETNPLSGNPELWNHDEVETLREELDRFRKEKEQIKRLVGQIGGVQNQKREKLLNTIFISALAVLFVGDVLRHFAGFKDIIPINSFFSLEIAVLLVSMKIIWMIHKQTKVEHFQFWILNSIEFRLNDLNKKMIELLQKVSCLEDKK